MRTLLSEVKSTKAQVKQANSENERLVETLRENKLHIEERIREAVEEKTAALVNDFEKRLAAIGQAAQKENMGENQIPIGNSKVQSIGFENKPENSLSPNVVDHYETRWVEPSDQLITDERDSLVDSNFTGKTKTHFPNPFKALDDSSLGKAAVTLHGKPNQRDIDSKPTPYYTIPENSILTESVALTALIGRIPLEGTVTDPYPFKILIGRENLMANGIELPDVEGAIVSGTAVGDWTLSCIRGEVKTITFIFSDGRISNGKSSPSTHAENASQDTKIGWLSDPNGVTCIPGSRKTNAPEYLTSQFLLSGAAAAAQNFAQGQTTTVVDGGSVVGAVTGNQGKYVLGQAIGGGLKEVKDWYQKRYGQTFDAIYAPPGQKIAVHITKELQIDYDSNARKVKYHQATGRRQID